MSPWTVEWLRLWRTKRWLILLGVYGFFGVLGPVTARYLEQILQRFGTGDIQIDIPAPTPVDGIAQFVGNASQLGVLAVVIVAAGALAFDARPELSAFYRTREPRVWRLLLPRCTVVAAGGALALVVGTALAWAFTAALLGSVSAAAMVVGTLLGAVYLGFLVAIVAATAGVTRSTVATVFGALVTAVTLPLLGLIAPLEPWLPSELLAAVQDLVAGAPLGHHWRALLVTVVVTAGLLAFAVRRFDRREL